MSSSGRPGSGGGTAADEWGGELELNMLWLGLRCPELQAHRFDDACVAPWREAVCGAFKEPRYVPRALPSSRRSLATSLTAYRLS